MPAGDLKHKWHWCVEQMLKRWTSQRQICFDLIIKAAFDLSCQMQIEAYKKKEKKMNENED